MHPPSGYLFEDDVDDAIEVYDVNAAIDVFGSASCSLSKDKDKGLLESDFIYFDHGRNANLTKILNDDSIL